MSNLPKYKVSKNRWADGTFEYIYQLAAKKLDGYDIPGFKFKIYFEPEQNAWQCHYFNPEKYTCTDGEFIGDWEWANTWNTKKETLLWALTWLVDGHDADWVKRAEKEAEKQMAADVAGDELLSSYVAMAKAVTK